ncbi:MAG: hypothetical protein WKF78_11030 [Candidatus Limnocylindrales bacterium]
MTPSMDPGDRRPAGLCAGAGHVVLYGNPAFVARFGARCIGMPAREVMVDLPDAAFQTLDAVLAEGRPLARWVQLGDEEWRMTVTPRRDPEDDLDLWRGLPPACSIGSAGGPAPGTGLTAAEDRVRWTARTGRPFASSPARWYTSLVPAPFRQPTRQRLAAPPADPLAALPRPLRDRERGSRAGVTPRRLASIGIAATIAAAVIVGIASLGPGGSIAPVGEVQERPPPVPHPALHRSPVKWRDGRDQARLPSRAASHPCRLRNRRPTPPQPQSRP